MIGKPPLQLTNIPLPPFRRLSTIEEEMIGRLLALLPLFLAAAALVSCTDARGVGTCSI